MKKSTKTSKTPAPAKPAVKSAKKKSEAPAIKQASATPMVTTISAQIDVGFGNQLYLRGDGPGLSWERGVAMTCVSDDVWSLEIAEVAKPISCKFLLNDLVWSAGEDFIVAPGSKVSFVPQF